MSMYSYTLDSHLDFEILNIDHYLQDALRKSGVLNGIMLVYCPHTTAGITINENGDPDVLKDLIYAFHKISPIRKEYRHFEGNSHSHLLSTLVGASENLIIKDGDLLLGTWQSVYFCEFDGPRKRTIHVKIV